MRVKKEKKKKRLFNDLFNERWLLITVFILDFFIQIATEVFMTFHLTAADVQWETARLTR